MIKIISSGSDSGFLGIEAYIKKKKVNFLNMGYWL